MKATISAITGLMLLSVSLLVSNTVEAADFFNKLGRCKRNNRTTLCFEASSVPTSMSESCNIFMLRTQLERVHGGGLYFGPTPDADDTAYPSLKCDFAIVTSLYEGFIRPCAPGGPAGWTHRSLHSVLPVLQDPVIVPLVRNLPLPQSTCDEGGSIP